MSKVTSICGTPRGAGGICSRLNWPRILLSAAISRSPWNTRIVTALWLSSAVEKIWLFLVGIVVLRSMSRVKTPPSVSMPRLKWRHVEQHDVLDVALQHAGLDRRAGRHHLVGVDALVRLLAEELRHFLDHLRHAGHAADQHHLVDLGLGDAGVLQRLLARLHRPRDQVGRPGSRAWPGSASAPGAAAGGSSGPSR